MMTLKPRIKSRSIKLLAVAGLLGGSLLSTGCQTTDAYTGEQKYNSTTKGAVGGALAGAAIGAITGDSERAAKGAVVGGLVGGGVGYYMDRQEAKLREQLRATGVSVTRSGNTIILNMPGNITFATDSSDIASSFYRVLDSVSLVIKEFDKTYVEVIGHTDSTGSDSYNMQLSQRRADSVSQYFMSRGITPQRLVARGMGESQPIASNATAAGRAQNRRVEIYLNPIR